MNRPIFFLACSSIVALGIAACGDDDTGTTPPSTTDSGTVTPTDSGTNNPADTGTTPPKDAAPDAPNVVADSGPTPGAVDRAGRPLISHLLVKSTNGNAYNHATAFGALPQFVDSDFQTYLVTADRLDTTSDWNGGEIPDGGPIPDGGVLKHPLGALLKMDALLVDTSKPFGATSYFEIEAEVLGLSGAHATCGGRFPGEDVGDKTLSVLVKKSLTGVSDGVSAPTKAATQTFPYLAAPN